MELAVDVAAYLTVRLHTVQTQADAYRDGCRDSHHVALLNQQLAGLVAELADLLLRNGAACPQLGDRSRQSVSSRTVVFHFSFPPLLVFSLLVFSSPLLFSSPPPPLLFNATYSSRSLMLGQSKRRVERCCARTACTIGTTKNGARVLLLHGVRGVWVAL